MARKIFTDESLATLVDETKAYVDGAVSTKANSSHNHSASNITSGTMSTARLPAASGTSAGITIVYPAASCTTFSSDSGTVTPLAVQKGAKMFAITRPPKKGDGEGDTSVTVNAIPRWEDTTGDLKNSNITIEDVTNTKDSSKKANVLVIPAEGGKKMVYGYCTDQTDGTSFIGGVFDNSATSYPYASGLAIGGTSGNLLWKGKQVATTDMIPTLSSLGGVPTSRTVNGKALSSNVTLSASDVGAASSSHNHAASNITSGTLSSDRLPTVPISKGGTGATTAEGALENLGIASLLSSGCKVATGSYEGTNNSVYGRIEDTTVTLNFDFEPKLLIVTSHARFIEEMSEYNEESGYWEYWDFMTEHGYDAAVFVKGSEYGTGTRYRYYAYTDSTNTYTHRLMPCWHITWSGTSVSYCDRDDNSVDSDYVSNDLNTYGYTYHYVAIG